MHIRMYGFGCKLLKICECEFCLSNLRMSLKCIGIAIVITKECLIQLLSFLLSLLIVRHLFPNAISYCYYIIPFNYYVY